MKTLLRLSVLTPLFVISAGGDAPPVERAAERTANRQAHTLIQLGRALADVSLHDEKVAVYRRARTSALRIGDLATAAYVTNAIARHHDDRGELASACTGYEDARRLYRQAGHARATAIVQLNVGRCYAKLGDVPQTRGHLEKALALARELSDPRREADALRELGWWRYLQGRPSEARTLLEQALALDPERGAYDRLGTVYLELGELDVAREHYMEALAGALGDRAEEVNVQGNLCELELRAGRLERALAHCLKSLDLLPEGDAGPRAAVLLRVAELERLRGRLEPAETFAAQAVEAVETRRPHAGDADLRGAFFAERLDAHRLLIALRMALHARQPDARWDARALEVYEQTRARGLADLLHARGVDASRLPAAEPPEPARIRSFLDDDTLLLLFHLGEERVYLWLVTSGGVAGHDLGPASEIETAARRWYRGLSERRYRRSVALGQEPARRLGERLLRPIAHELAAYDRLAVVADGALQLVPWSALPSPAGGGQPLVADHEIVGLPSAAVLAALREADGREPAQGLLAVVADPVYGHDDERLLVPPSTPPPDAAWQRLRGSAHEARELLRLASETPAGRRRSVALQGFDARLDRILDGELDGYRILHFATHGSLGDPPGLMLSRFDPRGEPLPERLGLPELFGLDLPAELAVLSACGTALGQDLAGEGLMGLARGFFHAGTPRLVVSLWPVQDRETRALMTEFYRALLHERAGPAEALRRAQVATWRAGVDARHWAAFTILGDWRPFPLGGDNKTGASGSEE